MKRHLLILCILLGLVGTRASAYDFEVNGIYYNLISATEFTCEVTSGDVKYSGNIKIPATVSYSNRTVSVVRISGSAFNDCTDLTNVTIPNSVTKIESYTFSGCRHLTSVTIPNSVTSIGSHAFSGCENLTSVTIPNSVTKIESYTFSDCTFLTSVTIPNSVTSIGECAFQYCPCLESITIPASVTSIGSKAFLSCGSTAVCITDLEAWCKIAFEKGDSNPLSCGGHLYLNDEEVKDLIIPNSVTSIGNYAFYACKGFTSITIPNSVTSIGSYAFYGCYPEELVIEDRSTTFNLSSLPDCSNIYIGMNNFGNAFQKKTSLRKVVLGNNVKCIESEAFEGCSNLTSVTIGNGVEEIKSYAFLGCVSLSNLTMRGETPPTLSVNTFTEVQYTQIKVLVNEDYLSTFQSANVWSFFWNWGVASAIDDGKYYLYDEKLKLFLTRGESWGTCACVDKYGIPFYWDSGKGSIRFLDNGLYLYEADPTYIYTDSENSTGFQFVKKDGGYCLKSLKTTTYLTLAEGSHGLKILTTTSDINVATVWQLISRTEHDAIVAGYTTENYEHVIAEAESNFTSDKFVECLSACKATDMTSYIGTARFAGNVGNWTYNEVRAQEWQPAYGTDFCELWQATGSYTQTITGLPKGIYKVTMQGFERSGSYAKCNALGESGYEITTAYLKANNEQVNLKSWYSEKLGTDYPNNTTDAVNRFSHGCYMNELYTYVGNDGKLTLTVNKPSHVGDNWLLFNNFTLTHYEEVKVTGITLDKTQVELIAGESVILTATVMPENATYKTVTWVSTNPRIATVTDEGVVTALIGGRGVSIIARIGGYEATCTIRTKTIPVTNISLDKVSAQLTEGETVTLTATVSPDNATDKTVTWTSSDETVATVKDGVVTAIAAGKATITAKAGNYIAACGVTVNAKIIHVTNISLDKVSAELTEGETVTLTATVSPDNATDKTVTWTSSDETVATVKDGVVTAIAAGKATITAKVGNYIATCGVTVKAEEIAISSIVLDKNEIEVTDEDDFMLTATIYPENATNKDVVWEIADEEIVINLYQNIFMAIKEGVTTITAKAGDKTATCTVTVKKADGIENSEAEDNTWPADIYDITGRMVKKNATSTDDLEKGIYLIKGRKVIIK